ncbi:unnamed protein product [Rangifer tarandus platyrhynchus]|uniref:Uncharacterized protein n=2 Tax=Rangifer tarandus platyrhynchus TaxID=3082113 RepID=A0ABN8YRG7_RANTA|nr:unnamed protein product [Rangifer tarandus platyrhynchus]
MLRKAFSSFLVIREVSFEAGSEMIEVYATRVRNVTHVLKSEENVSSGELVLPVASEVTVITELAASSILFFFLAHHLVKLLNFLYFFRGNSIILILNVSTLSHCDM